jgi:phosphoribosylaminoimidazolecarboxamide formyltransferase/IMP cyclohydrolase
MIRLLKTGDLNAGTKEKATLKKIVGGMLLQDRDIEQYSKWETVTAAQFPQHKVGLARFAWIACKHVKSNAIILAQEYFAGCYKVIGMGAGQPNRVDSLRKLAVTKAQENLGLAHEAAGREKPKDGKYPKEFAEFVLASDAFFPFPDNIEEAAAAGVRYIVQPGGSKRDDEVIAACNRLGISMVFTGTRHFRH